MNFLTIIKKYYPIIFFIALVIVSVFLFQTCSTLKTERAQWEFQQKQNTQNWNASKDSLFEEFNRKLNAFITSKDNYVINEIKDSTGVEIDIEEDGTIYITGETVGAEKAKTLIEEIVKEYKEGDKVTGEVVRVADFGVIVKLDSRNDGLVHVSEIAPFRIEKVETYMKIGMKVPIVIKGIDDKGRLKLSIKDADPNFIQKK